MTALRRVAAVIAGFVLLMGLASAPAQASVRLSPSPASCPGTHHHHIAGGQLSVFMTYLSASGGTNCAWVQKDVRRGTPESLHIWIYRCVPGNWDGRLNCPIDQTDYDGGTDLRYYAGDNTRVTGTAGRCIEVDVLYRGVHYDLPVHHCG